MPYTLTRGMKEWYLDPNEFREAFIDKCDIFNINPNEVKFYSQQDEDKYIIQYILKNKINDGTYIEVGGCDGILYSNTKTLEDFFGFTGILIEPQPYFYSKLIKNRSQNKCFNRAVSNSDYKYISFVGDNAEGGIYENTNTDIKKYNWHPYQVHNSKMKDIIKESGFKYIDFLIIDVEGSELELLKSIDFSFPIFCIIIEAHSGEQEKNKIFGNYLKQHGFTFKERQRGNEVWFNLNYHRKNLFNI